MQNRYSFEYYKVLNESKKAKLTKKKRYYMAYQFWDILEG